MEKHYGRRYYKYYILMFLISVIGLVAVLGYYFYIETHQPDVDPQFSSLVTSMNQLRSDEYLYVKVKIDSINVRKTNVVKSDNIIGNVIKDDIYKVTDIKKGATFYWYYIVDKEGRKGCIPSGSDELFVETFIIKNDVEQILSSISNYNGSSEDEPTTREVITTTVPTTVTTTSDINTTTKKTTTKKVTPTPSPTTTTTTQSTKKKATGLQLKVAYSMDQDGDSCIYYITVTAEASGGEEPYQYDIKLYKNGQLYRQNINYGNTIKSEVEPGDYLAVASVIGTKLTVSKETTLAEEE